MKLWPSANNVLPSSLSQFRVFSAFSSSQPAQTPFLQMVTDMIVAVDWMFVNISTGWFIGLWGHFWAAPDKFSAGLAWKNLWPLEGTGGQWAANNVNRWGRSPPGFLWKRRSSAHCKIASAICRNQEVWEKSVGKLYIPPAAGRTTNSCTLQIKLFQK